jgi:UDP-GlcNAc:undecaprenyl-phosphate GlcNAc-1-phosphate transferase
MTFLKSLLDIDALSLIINKAGAEYLVIFFIFCLLSIRSFLTFGLKFFKKNLVASTGVQNIHSGFVPRVGGFVFFISFIFLSYIQSNNFSFILASIFIPLLILMLIEDFCQIISPLQRIFGSIFLVLFCLIYLTKSGFLKYPTLNYPILSFITSNYCLATVFYTLSIIAFLNGKNLIDGLNGNAIFSSIGIFIAIAQIASQNNLLEIFEVCFIAISCLLALIIFNYPFAKVFLGDSGAYFIAFIESVTVIALFSMVPLSPFLAVLILIYPLTELIFSMLRKFFFYKVSVMQADRFHLHLQIFFLLNNFLKNDKISNPLASLFLLLFSLFPAFAIRFSISKNNPLLVIGFFLSIYCLLYFIVRKLKYKYVHNK